MSYCSSNMQLDAYLKLHSIKRAHFARSIGRSKAAVTRYASGQQVPDSQTLRLILQATGGAVMPNDFFLETTVIDPAKGQAA